MAKESGDPARSSPKGGWTSGSFDEILGLSETEQDPMGLAPHILSLQFLYGKTLTKE